MQNAILNVKAFDFVTFLRSPKWERFLGYFLLHFQELHLDEAMRIRKVALMVISHLWSFSHLFLPNL